MKPGPGEHPLQRVPTAATRLRSAHLRAWLRVSGWKNMRRDVQAWALIVGGLLWFSLAQASWAASLVFEPNSSNISYVPLSAFQEKTANRTATLSFLVRSNILAYNAANGGSLWVAWRSNDGGQIVIFLRTTSVDAVNGVVTLTTNLVGRFTVVSTRLTNNFPLVNHWQQSLNGGEGGVAYGAADTSIGTITLDAANDTIVYSDNVRNHDPAKTYYYKTDCRQFNPCYRLFANDPTYPTARTPDYERYPFENYSEYAVSNLAALWLSDQLLRNTGYPILFRNYPWALNQTQPAAKQVMRNVPVFQIVHNHLISTAPGKDSLADFLLPPNWVPNPKIRYPVLLSGAYDPAIHLFVDKFGAVMLAAIGQLMNEGRGPALGILWNSGSGGAGGSTGARGVHRSAYDNAQLLMRTADNLLGADRFKVMTAGTSRGGMTALAHAANPYNTNPSSPGFYTVRYAVSFVQSAKWGEMVKYMLSYAGGAYGFLDEHTGYLRAWKLGWQEPGTGYSAFQRTLLNIFGAIDAAAVDKLSPWSDTHVAQMKNKGTKVVFYVSTHDTSLAPALKYVDKLRAWGVPVRFELAYRAGHASDPNDLLTHVKTYLQKLLTNDSTFSAGTFHYKRINESSPLTLVEFSPSFQPAILEAPGCAFWGRSVTLAVIGGAGSDYNLGVYKIDDNAWNADNSTIIKTSDRIPVLSGAFSSSGPPIQSATFTANFNASVTPGWYLYELQYRPAGQRRWRTIPDAAVPRPWPGNTAHPVFYVGDTEPDLNGWEMGICPGIWGLSDDSIRPVGQLP